MFKKIIKNMLKPKSSKRYYSSSSRRRYSRRDDYRGHGYYKRSHRSSRSFSSWS